MSEQVTTPEPSTTTSPEVKQEPTSTPPSVTSPDSSPEVKPEEAAKPETEKPAEEKPAAEASKEEAAPVQDEEYEIEVKEGSVLTQADLDELAATAADLGLNKEQAQKLVESREKVVASAMKAGESKWEAKFQEDMKTFNNDPEFAGEKRAIADQHMGRAITAFGDPDLVAYLNTPQGGSNVHLAKFLVRIGQALAPVQEGNSDLTRQGGSAPAPKEENVLERMYPTMFPKK